MLINRPLSPSGQGKKTALRRASRRQEGLPAGVLIDLRILVIVQTGTTQLAVVHREAQWLHQMQCAARVGSQPDDVAGVGRYLGLNQNNVKHGLNCRRCSVVGRARDDKPCDMGCPSLTHGLRRRKESSSTGHDVVDQHHTGPTNSLGRQRLHCEGTRQARQALGPSQCSLCWALAQAQQQAAVGLFWCQVLGQQQGLVKTSRHQALA